MNDSKLLRHLRGWFRRLYSRMSLTQSILAAAAVVSGIVVGLVFESINPALAVLIGLAVALLSALLSAIWFRDEVAKPVRQMTEATRHIAAGSYGTELPLPKKPDLAELAESINALSQEVSRTEKM